MEGAIERELLAGLGALGLDARLADPLLRYLALLDRWNRAYNLTAIRDPQAMVTLHLLDSLAMHDSVAGIAARGGSPRSGHRVQHVRDLGGREVRIER